MLRHTLLLGLLCFAGCESEQGGAQNSKNPDDPQVLAERFLSPQNPTERALVVERLSVLGVKAASAAPTIARALDNPSPSVRVFAIGLLSKLGPEAAKPYARAIERQLQHKEVFVRIAASQTLLSSGLARERAVATLLQELDKSRRPSTKNAIRQVLLGIDERAAAVLPLITNLLGRADPRMRTLGLELLERLGAAAAPAIPALQPLLGDPVEALRSRSEKLIRRLAGLRPPAKPL